MENQTNTNEIVLKDVKEHLFEVLSEYDNFEALSFNKLAKNIETDLNYANGSLKAFKTQILGYIVEYQNSFRKKGASKVKKSTEAGKKEGKYSAEEQNIIKEHIAEHCRTHNVELQDLCCTPANNDRTSTARRTTLWSELAALLPHRTKIVSVNI